MISTKRKIPTLTEFADKYKPLKLNKTQRDFIKMMDNKYPDRRLVIIDHHWSALDRAMHNVSKPATR